MGRLSSTELVSDGTSSLIVYPDDASVRIKFDDTTVCPVANGAIAQSITALESSLESNRMSKPRTMNERVANFLVSLSYILSGFLARRFVKRV